MKNKLKYILLVAIMVGFVTSGFSQHKTYDIKNGFAIAGGITKFDIQTDNFNTKEGNGWTGGMSATVDIPHKWYNVSYSMQLSENYISILGSNGPSTVNNLEEIEYKMFAAQVALLMHIKLIKTYLTIDVGPMLQYNGKLEIKDDTQELFIIDNYNALRAEDLANISQFQFNGAVGASAGFNHFRVKAQYIYGFTNILNKLNDQNLDTTGFGDKFKGNQTMLVFGIMFTF